MRFLDLISKIVVVSLPPVSFSYHIFYHHQWLNPSDIEYGEALGALQLCAVVSVEGEEDMRKYEGELVYSPPAETILNVGATQSLHVRFVPKDPTRCEVAEKVVFITVKPPKKLQPVIQVWTYYGERNDVLCAGK